MDYGYFLTNLFIPKTQFKSYVTEQGYKYEGKWFINALGQMIEGCPHGKGVYITDGVKYDGEFVYGYA